MRVPKTGRAFFVEKYTEITFFYELSGYDFFN